MERRTRIENLGKFFWGLVFIIVGVILGANALDLTDINIFFNGWWTLFIIIPNVIGLFSNKDNKFNNFVGVVVGIILLLTLRGILDTSTVSKLFIPFILVLIGLSIIFNNIIKNKITEKIREKRKDELEPIVATFAEQKINMDDEEFKGANIDVVFTSVALDLQKAKITKEAVIKASSIFGGIEIKVPSDANIKVKSRPIFGGVSNKILNKVENEKTIYIEAFCLFGGVEIK